MGSADAMRKAIEIIIPKLKENRIGMVVSAMGGKPKVTDLLLNSVHAAADCKLAVSKALLEQIKTKHKECVDDILARSPDAANRIMSQIEKDITDIEDILRAVVLMRNAHEQILELVSGYGEIWSASLICEVFIQEGYPFTFLNAREVLLVSEGELGTEVHWEESERKLNDFLSKINIDPNLVKEDQRNYGPHLVITGYVASTLDGKATTLKRDGSDFSASIFGKMLHSKSITIWTDVSGVYSADPRVVSEAKIIPELSYSEAIELAYFGAKVIHPKTMNPAILDKIPIFIRNTFEPFHPGTRIYLPPAKGQTLREECVCGFSTIDNVALLNLEAVSYTHLTLPTIYSV